MLEPDMGEIAILPYEFEPEGWKRCDGQRLPINNDHMALFSLIGNRYGGDGARNFHLPKMPPLPTEEGATLGYFISIKGIYPSRDRD